MYSALTCGSLHDIVMLYKNEGSGSNDGGFLSSLLGAGCECEGYDIRIVGHSLGGAISALLGLRVRAYHGVLNFVGVSAYCVPCVWPMI